MFLNPKFPEPPTITDFGRAPCRPTHPSAPASTRHAARRIAPTLATGAGAVAAVVTVGVVLTALVTAVAVTAVSVTVAALVLRSLLTPHRHR